jgi:hypothetical protein
LRPGRLIPPGVLVIAVSFGLARYTYGPFVPDIRADLDISTGSIGLTAGAGGPLGRRVLAQGVARLRGHGAGGGDLERVAAAFGPARERGIRVSLAALALAIRPQIRAAVCGGPHRGRRHLCVLDLRCRPHRRRGRRETNARTRGSYAPSPVQSRRHTFVVGPLTSHRAALLPLFTRVRGRVIPRTSPRWNYAKFTA